MDPKSVVPSSRVAPRQVLVVENDLVLPSERLAESIALLKEASYDGARTFLFLDQRRQHGTRLPTGATVTVEPL